jgi:hypothetical protein
VAEVVFFGIWTVVDAVPEAQCLTAGRDVSFSADEKRQTVAPWTTALSRTAPAELGSVAGIAVNSVARGLPL